MQAASNCIDSVSITSNPICQGQSTTLTVHTDTAGSSFIYSWNMASGLVGTGGTISPDSTISDTVTVSGTGCTTNSIIKTITVHPLPVITDTPAGSRCGTGTVLLSATTSAGTIRWWASDTSSNTLATGPNFTTPSISADTIFYVDAIANGCSSSSRLAVTATVKPVPFITDSLPQNSCGPDSLTLAAFASGGTVYWFTTLNGGSAIDSGNLFTTPNLSASTTYYVNATENGCTTANRVPVLARIYAVPVVSITPLLTAHFCIGQTAAVKPACSSNKRHRPRFNITGAPPALNAGITGNGPTVAANPSAPDSFFTMYS